MARIYRGRYTADMDREFVVFLIGMRINKPWMVHKWFPVFVAMRPMLKELFGHPEKGMLGAKVAWIGGPAVVEYWRSFEDLARFSRNPEDPHLPAWRRFNRRVSSSGDVGIWHETYKVRAGEYESIYGNMPRFGLAAVTEHVDVGKRGQSAARRIGASLSDEVPVPYYENME